MEEQLLFSEHGKERLMERLKCKETKIEKIVKKSLTSKGDNIPQIFKYLLKKDRGKNNFYKYYLGYIFVFAYILEGTLFVTLYNPKEEIEKTKNKYGQRKNTK